MRLFDLIMLILGAVCFLAEVYVSSRPQRGVTFNLLALGALFWIMVPLVSVAHSYSN